MIILLLTPRIMTTLFDPSQMGEYYLIITILSFFSLFIINPIGIFINRNAINWQKERTLSNKISFIATKFFPSLILVGFSIFYFINYFFHFLELSNNLLACLFLILIFKTNNETFSSVINMINYRKVFIFSQILTPLLIIIFTFLFYIFFDLEINFWFYSILLSNLLIFAYLYHFVWKLNLNEKVKWQSRDLLSFSSPLIISNIFMWFLFEGYRFILEDKISAFEFGIFVVGFGLATQIMSSLDSIYVQYLSPYLTGWMSNNDKELRHRKIDEYLMFTFSVYSILLILLIFFSEYIFLILIDEKFNEGIIYFKAGLYFEYFKVLINHIKNIGYSENNNNKTFIGYILGCLTFLFLMNSNILENHFEQILIISAFIAMIITYFVMNILILSYKGIYHLFFIVSFFILDFVKFNFVDLSSFHILFFQIIIFFSLNIYSFHYLKGIFLKLVK